MLGCVFPKRAFLAIFRQKYNESGPLCDKGHALRIRGLDKTSIESDMAGKLLEA
jgi:hypothetical protein